MVAGMTPIRHASILVSGALLFAACGGAANSDRGQPSGDFKTGQVDDPGRDGRAANGPSKSGLAEQGQATADPASQGTLGLNERPNLGQGSDEQAADHGVAQAGGGSAPAKAEPGMDPTAAKTGAGKQPTPTTGTGSPATGTATTVDKPVPGTSAPAGQGAGAGAKGGAGPGSPVSERPR